MGIFGKRESENERGEGALEECQRSFADLNFVWLEFLDGGVLNPDIQ